MYKQSLIEDDPQNAWKTTFPRLVGRNLTFDLWNPVFRQVAAETLIWSCLGLTYARQLPNCRICLFTSFNLYIHNFTTTKAESLHGCIRRRQNLEHTVWRFSIIFTAETNADIYIFSFFSTRTHSIMSLSFEIAMRLSNVEILTAGESFIVHFEIQTKFHSVNRPSLLHFGKKWIWLIFGIFCHFDLLLHFRNVKLRLSWLFSGKS